MMVRLDQAPAAFTNVRGPLDGAYAEGLVSGKCEIGPIPMQELKTTAGAGFWRSRSFGEFSSILRQPHLPSAFTYGHCGA